MGRYSKSYSNFILAKRHQNVNEGVIWSRDWWTIGNVHRLEPGKKPYYNDSNFIFTDNNLPYFKKKHDYGKWVANYIYDDVKDISSAVNEVIVNQNSNDMRSYAYYGSMVDLVQGSIENIITSFPGRLQSSQMKLTIINSEGVATETEYTVIDNPFGLDLQTETFSVVDYDNQLHYLRVSWQKYNIGHTTGSEGLSPIVSYEVINTEDNIPNEGKYHDEGYDYVIFKGVLYKWEDSHNAFIPVDYSDTCSNYFVQESEYILINGQFYKWEECQYVPITNAYEICNEDNQKIYDVVIKDGDGNTYIILVYSVEGQLVYCAEDNDIVIEPNKSVIDDYFKGLNGFEKKLLTRDSKPLYRNKFKVPFQNANGGYQFTEQIFTWPSNDYCIDISSISYFTFLNGLMDMAEVYDEVYSDCIWRCMTHESIKNFDWSYRRNYSENDTQDNIDGGNRMMTVLHFYGRIYDEAKRYVDGIHMTNNISYDGYNNVPDAEISDKNDIKGWDIVSTIWEPYYYVEIQLNEVPEGITPIPYPTLPVEVNSETPVYISIGCGDNVLYYKKTVNDPSLEFLTEEFLDNKDFIIGKHKSWITHNHNLNYLNIGCEIPSGKEYVEVSTLPVMAQEEDPEYILYDKNYYKKSYVNYVEIFTDPMSNFSNYWGDWNTFTSLPNTITSNSPEYIRIYNNVFYRYYGLTDIGFNNEAYTHSTWFNTKNPESTTPISCDISFQRNLHLSTNRIFKTKGTKIAIEMVMGMFGFGCDGDTPDYSITEYYNTTSPVKASDIFYFYDELADEPTNVTWDSTNTFSTLEDALVNIGATSPQYIKVVDNGVDFYYILVNDYTYEDMVAEFSRHKTTEKVYNTIYSGVPLNEFLIGNEKYIIPYHTNSRQYDGYLYFQEKGGWGKSSDNPDFHYDYMETVPYLHLLPSVDDLLLVFPNQVTRGDIYYVNDITDYVNYDEDVPFNLSHFFKIVDEFNPQRFSSWKNIPMEGEIVYNTAYNQNDVTHEDYLHAKYLNDIIPTMYFNNPHTGNGEYDLGKEFLEYMSSPYKYLFDTYSFDDDKYVNIAKQFTFVVNERIQAGSNEKFAKWLSTVVYAYNHGILEKEILPLNSDNYFLNDKLIVIENLKNHPLNNKFLKDVVMKYVLQVIPSTAILILKGFEITLSDEMNYYNITVEANNADFGDVEGTGIYLDTTYAVLRAMEKEGYHFVRWEKKSDSSLVSEEAITQVRVCKDETYVAVFEIDCIINTSCNTNCLKKCAINVSCDIATTCYTLIDCEVDTNAECNSSFTCETKELSDMAVVEFRVGITRDSQMDMNNAAERLNSVGVLDYIDGMPQCSKYQEATSRTDRRVAGSLNDTCLTTLLPITIDDIDPYMTNIDEFVTTETHKVYDTNKNVSFVAAKCRSGITFSQWKIEYPQSSQIISTQNPLTINTQAGKTKITAIYRKT